MNLFEAGQCICNTDEHLNSTILLNTSHWQVFLTFRILYRYYCLNEAKKQYTLEEKVKRLYVCLYKNKRNKSMQ